MVQAYARLNVPDEQKQYYRQIATDARVVECVPMSDVFSCGQLRFLKERAGYKTQRKMCYKNASDLVEAVELLRRMYPTPTEPAIYVEGYTLGGGVLPIEHAFVRIGDKYVDPTFERALHKDVRKEQYVALAEFDREELRKLQLETCYYGGMYQYAYVKKHRPDLAVFMAYRGK